MTSQELKELLERLEAGDEPSTDEIIAYGHQPGTLDALITASRESVEHRRLLLPVITELGFVVIEENEAQDEPELPGPVVTNPKVINFLVALLDDEDRQVRNMACEALAGDVPSTLLRGFSNVLLERVGQHPDSNGALLLLGKVDARTEALALLDETPALGATDGDNTIMVRARLGDPDAEQALYDAYRDADDAEQKGALAPRLGYAATDRLIGVLADEIRTPDFYVWNQRSRRSLRVHIIEALHVAFPMEPVFWKPFYQPEDDGYYEGIENWLATKLGTTRSRDRPEFLYQEDAPMGL